MLRRLEAANDSSLQTDDIDSILAKISREKQILDFCAAFRSPFPASDIIYEKLSTGVSVQFEQLYFYFTLIKRYEPAEFLQYVIQRCHWMIY